MKGLTFWGIIEVIGVILLLISIILVKLTSFGASAPCWLVVGLIFLGIGTVGLIIQIIKL